MLSPVFFSPRAGKDFTPLIYQVMWLTVFCRVRVTTVIYYRLLLPRITGAFWVMWVVLWENKGKFFALLQICVTLVCDCFGYIPSRVLKGYFFWLHLSPDTDRRRSREGPRESIGEIQNRRRRKNFKSRKKLKFRSLISLGEVSLGGIQEATSFTSVSGFSFLFISLIFQGLKNFICGGAPADEADADERQTEILIIEKRYGFNEVLYNSEPETAMSPAGTQKNEIINCFRYKLDRGSR